MKTINTINDIWNGMHYRNSKKQIIKRVLLFLNKVPFADKPSYSDSALICEHEACRKPIKCSLLKGNIEQWFIKGIEDVKIQFPLIESDLCGDDFKNHLQKHMTIQ